MLAGVIAATGIMYMTTQKELAPEEDQGILFNIVKTPQIRQSRLSRAGDRRAQQGVQHRAGEGARLHHQRHGGDVHQAFAGILFKPWDERQRNHKADPARACSRRSSSIAPAQAISFALPSLPGSIGGPPVQFVITTTRDFRSSRRCWPTCRRRRAKSGLFIFTDSDLKFETPQVEFKIDHDKANRLGITMADIGGSLATLLGGNYVNRFNLYGRSYQVIPQVPREFRLNEDWLTRYQVRTSAGTLVPLSNVATVKQVGAAQRAHELPAAQFGDAFRACRFRAARSARPSTS